MEVLVKKVRDNINSLFLKDIKKILLIQIVYQILLSALFYFFPHPFDLKLIQYINISSYFFIFIISFSTLKYIMANKMLAYLFVLEYFYFSFIPIILLYFSFLYTIQVITTVSVFLLITIYLFFFSMSPLERKIVKNLSFTVVFISIIISLTYSNVNIVVDISSLNNEDYWDTFNTLNLNSYYVNIICLSFMFFVWYTYNQGLYILSEFFPAVLAIHTLMIINEIYQLYNFNHLVNNFIDGQYFNAVINIGFIIIWLFRLHYISNPDSKKMEHFVLNYDMLSGYVEKPHNELWDAVLIKLGKQKLIFGSLLLFVIICIPLVLIGDISFFSRFNIIIMLFFLVSVMIYAIIYTQRKWFNHIGFLIRKTKNNKQ